MMHTEDPSAYPGDVTGMFWEGMQRALASFDLTTLAAISGSGRFYLLQNARIKLKQLYPTTTL